MDTNAPFLMDGAAALVERMMGDAGLCRGIVESALLEIPAAAGAIGAVRDGGPLKPAERAFHSLRGSASIFGATTFASLLQRLEMYAEAGSREEVLAALDECSRGLARYEESLKVLARELEVMG